MNVQKMKQTVINTVQPLLLQARTAHKRSLSPVVAMLLGALGFLLVNPSFATEPTDARPLADEKAPSEQASAIEAPQWPNATAANQVVLSIADRLITLITEAKAYFDEDEKRYYDELEVVLNDYFDFASFSRAVMGRYAGRKAMEAKDEAGQAKLQAQIERFKNVFRAAMVQTYGKGLLVFDGEKIEVVAPNEEAEKRAAQGKATVKQLIFGDRETPYEVLYSLKRNKAGEWKIRNMIVESSNLGKLYRNQFSNAYKVYEGDIDKVIDNWAVAQ